VDDGCVFDLLRSKINGLTWVRRCEHGCWMANQSSCTAGADWDGPARCCRDDGAGGLCAAVEKRGGVEA